MSSGLAILNERFVDEAAFELLSCSNSACYNAIAENLAMRSGLRGHLWKNPDLVSKVVDSLLAGFERLRASDERSVDEILLAVTLPVVRESGDPRVIDLLVATESCRVASCRWISGLAHKLLQRGVTTDFVQPVGTPTADVTVDFGDPHQGKPIEFALAA